MVGFLGVAVPLAAGRREARFRFGLVLLASETGCLAHAPQRRVQVAGACEHAMQRGLVHYPSAEDGGASGQAETVEPRGPVFVEMTSTWMSAAK